MSKSEMRRIAIQKNLGTIDPKSLIKGQNVRFHDPVKGIHKGIVISTKPLRIASYTTFNNAVILMTQNHTILEIL